MIKKRSPHQQKPDVGTVQHFGFMLALDDKELTAGASLFIPVYVKGTLFEINDGHGAQGNGEVDIMAIEKSLKGKLQFILHKNKELLWPMAETATHIITMEAIAILMQQHISPLGK